MLPDDLEDVINNAVLSCVYSMSGTLSEDSLTWGLVRDKTFSYKLKLTSSGLRLGAVHIIKVPTDIEYIARWKPDEDYLGSELTVDFTITEWERLKFDFNRTTLILGSMTTVLEHLFYEWSNKLGLDMKKFLRGNDYRC